MAASSMPAIDGGARMTIECVSTIQSPAQLFGRQSSRVEIVSKKCMALNPAIWQSSSLKLNYCQLTAADQLVTAYRQVEFSGLKWTKVCVNDSEVNDIT